MRIQAFSQLARKMEPAVVVLLLLYYLDPQLPPGTGGLLKYASYGLVGLLFLSVGSGQWQRLAYVATKDPFPLILLGMSIASILWSAAPNYTMDEIDPVVRASILGAYLAMRFSPREQMRLFACALGLAAVLSFFYGLALPGKGVAMTNGEASWKGVFNHKQYLGRFMAIGAITFLNVALENKRYQPLAWIGFVAAIALVWLSSSKSALILILLSLGSLPLYKFIKQRYKLRVILLTISFLLVGSLAVLVVGNFETIVVDILGKNLELNGRLPVWTLAIEKGLERPILGYGYAGFWTSEASTYVIENTWAAGRVAEGVRFHAHNGFIDVFLQLGLLGLSLCLVSFVRLLVRTAVLSSLSKGREFFWIFQFLLITFVANISEVRTFVGGDALWVLYVSLSLSTAISVSRARINGFIQRGVSRPSYI